MEYKKRIWVAWETQRRSIELSNYYKCKLFIIEPKGKSRYYKCLTETIAIFRKEKPSLIFVQNPSMVLAALACFYSLFTKTPVVVDRHTTFMLSEKYKKNPWLLYKPSMLVFRLLHWFTIRFADITIVTNKYLADIVDKMGGRSFVLPDKLPHIPSVETIPLVGHRNVLFITSFGNDEPIQAAVDAMNHLSTEDVCLYVTGNYKKFDKDLPEKIPENIKLTGFVSEDHFMALLRSVDIVMVLTTSDHCMLCGCYEAVAAKKPLVTTNKDEMKGYFEGAVFVDNSPEHIAKNIDEVLGSLPDNRANILKLKEKLDGSWEEMAVDLESRSQALSGINNK